MNYMKPKTKEFVDILLEDPKISATNAYLATHETTNRTTAKNNAHQTLKKPNVQIYMQKHAKRAANRIVELIDSEKEDMSFKASVEILDRTYGKAIQKSVNQNTNLNVNVEASKELADNFTEFLKQNTAT